MKTKIITIALVAVTSLSSNLWAQSVAPKSKGWDLAKNVKCRVIPTETGFSITFDHLVKVSVDNVVASSSGKKGYDYWHSTSEYQVSSSDNTIVQVISSREAASGMATGKRQHKPIRIENEVDKATPVLYEKVSSSETTTGGLAALGTGGGAAGKAVFKEFTMTKRCGGVNEKYTLVNGEAVVPTGDCPNGNCGLKITWTWQDGGIDNTDWVVSKKKTGNNSADFILTIEDGVCTAMAINEKGLPGDKKPNKKAIVPKN
jgi:type VI secretion system secreted protein Hcp